MKTLYLHIGTAKTATSSIQKFLADNRQILETHGYCFPRSKRAYPNVSTRRNGHFLVGKVVDENGVRDRQKEELYLQEGLEQVREAFASYENVILSDEIIWYHLSYGRKSILKTLKKEADAGQFQLKVIVYLRRQDAYLLSRWNQSVKQNMSFAATLTCEEYFAVEQEKDAQIYEYGRKLDKIAAVVGKENLIVRRFEPHSWREGSIIYDFMHEIGMDVTDEFQILEEPVNLRLGKNATEIKRLVNCNENFSAEEIAYLGNFLREISNCGKREIPSEMLSKEELQQFLSKYEAENQRVAEEYIGDGKPLFSAEIKDVPKWNKENEQMPDDTLRFLMAVLMDMRRENQAKAAEIKELRKEINRLKMFREKVKHPSRTLLQKMFGQNAKGKENK